MPEWMRILGYRGTHHVGQCSSLQGVCLLFSAVVSTTTEHQWFIFPEPPSER